ncbi:hypothetical protein SELMODRAFT_161889 [Selaginella moellendorffii]|uniref:Uncharacterized protein n=1 Tax=Selaginella moellendorffii TaxID=88036 RepID=D8T819_SELML|nr:uncharacterized protein LOC9633440 [Selaginella moellendorffii]EFJ07175.1 hypothetical protein SELMODRAFT_161889 [Selaginella moellendorffii]|eukprot:XP_002991771.1 uncharacterized protein LOC9633440 [Selaginella moellendorffii]
MADQDLKKDAVVWKGPESLKQAISLLEEFKLPGGLLPLEEVIEVGYVKATGYMWITTAKKIEHNFAKIKKLVSYSTSIHGFLSDKKIAKLQGVKAKELLIWAPVGQIMADADDAVKNVHFKSFAGITKTFPTEAFALGE